MDTTESKVDYSVYLIEVLDHFLIFLRGMVDKVIVLHWIYALVAYWVKWDSTYSY